MIYSMTGYGKAESNIGTKKVTVEIKSVNSKTFDCNLRTPSFFREKEMQIRSLLAKELIRGKIEVNVNYTSLETEQKHFVNKGLVKRYYQDLLDVVNEAELSNKDKIDFLAIVMKMPEVMRSEREALSKENAESYVALVEHAIEQFTAFRIEEGVSLQNDIFSNINTITSLLSTIEPFEQERIEIVKERIKKNLESLIDKPNIDENRYHQELIYYIEKLDVSEEKVRLKAHCEHFLKTANSEGVGKGKKLGFITQEIGREINTLGSKANHAEMQKIVVLMKDALEKIKEQILNVL